MDEGVSNGVRPRCTTNGPGAGHCTGAGRTTWAAVAAAEAAFLKRSETRACRDHLCRTFTPAGSCGSPRASRGNRARHGTSWICYRSEVGGVGPHGKNSVRVVGGEHAASVLEHSNSKIPSATDPQQQNTPMGIFSKIPLYQLPMSCQHCCRHCWTMLGGRWQLSQSPPITSSLFFGFFKKKLNSRPGRPRKTRLIPIKVAKTLVTHHSILYKPRNGRY